MRSKWIEIPSTDAPAAEVARLALAARVAKVKRMLPLAAYQYQQDVEHVHQLRTGCRRATAAVEAFRPLMSGKPKSLKKLLRRIRKAAGPARDADVLLARFEGQSPAEEDLDDVVAPLISQRIRAQEALVTVAEDSRSGKLKKAVRRTLKSLGRGDRDHHPTSIARFGRGALQAAAQPLFQLASIPQPAITQLHELRIAGKRLRYSIELFHGVFPPEMRGEVYPVVEELQERLGRLNDHATAQVMFQSWLADLPPGQRAANLAQRIIAEHDAVVEASRDFLDWWTLQKSTSLQSSLNTLLEPID